MTTLYPPQYIRVIILPLANQFKHLDTACWQDRERHCGTKRCRHSGLLCQECRRRFRQQGGGATGSRCGVETRSLSCCLPRLCGRSSDWQSAGLLWPTADTLLTQALLRKREVGGIAVQQVNMWHAMGSLVQLCVHVLCFHFAQKKKSPSSSFWLLYTDSHPTQVTWRGGGGFHWSKLWYQQPLWPPVMNYRAGEEQQDPPNRTHLHNPRDGPLQRLFLQELDQHMEPTMLLFSFFVQGLWVLKAFPSWQESLLQFIPNLDLN